MKPNRLQLTIALILIVLALILAVYFGKRSSLKPASTSSQGKASSIRELVAQPVDIKDELQKTDKIPPNCTELWGRIAAGTFEEFRNYSDDDKTLMSNCSQAVPILAKHDPGHIEKLRAACSTPDQEGSNAMESNCILYFYFYKAALVAFSNGDKAPGDLTTNELALLVFHEYNNLDNRRLAYLAQLVDELVARNPSYSTIKAKASIQLFQLMENISTARADALVETLHDLQAQNPADEQLFEMQFVALAMQNAEGAMNQFTETYVKDHPSSPTAHYIRSAYFWQEKDRDQAFASLKNAIAIDPTSQRFQETRDKIEKAPLGSRGLYNVNVNFDLVSE